MKIKQVLFGSWIVITILAAIGGGTAIQLLPIVAFIGLLGAGIYANKKVQVPALILSIVMLFINAFTYEPSAIDVVAWCLTSFALLFMKE